MATKTESIMALLNHIRNDRELVLPDIQRDFVWSTDQIRLLMDTIMREYPFGSLLLWQTRFLEVPYRDFVKDYEPGLTFVPQIKSKGAPLRMVLDGQQRLQSLYLAVYGTYGRKKLFFNITSGPGAQADRNASDEGAGGTYRFEFWNEEDANRPKRLISVGRIATWPSRLEDTETNNVVNEAGRGWCGGGGILQGPGRRRDSALFGHAADVPAARCAAGKVRAADGGSQRMGGKEAACAYSPP